LIITNVTIRTCDPTETSLQYSVFGLDLGSWSGECDFGIPGCMG
jgi:hypothetical protein